jgi:chromosome partitioning protein
MNVIVISNQKGGTAKTTTAAAVLLSREGFRVHLVDSDPQASLTTAFGLTDPKGLLYEAMCRRGPLPIVSHTDNLTITPSSINLSKGETQFIAEAGRVPLSTEVLGRTARRRQGKHSPKGWSFRSQCAVFP